MEEPKRDLKYKALDLFEDQIKYVKRIKLKKNESMASWYRKLIDMGIEQHKNSKK